MPDHANPGNSGDSPERDRPDVFPVPPTSQPTGTGWPAGYSYTVPGTLPPDRPRGGRVVNPAARKWKRIAVIGIPVAFLLGCGVGGAAVSADGQAEDGAQGKAQTAVEQKTPAATPTSDKPADKPAQSAPTTKPPAPAKPAAPVDPEPVKIGNGVHQVGVDIKPGRYRTSGPDGDSFSGMCYWTRLKNDSGELDAIIANDLIEGKGSLTVKSSDKFVEFSGDCTWIKQ